MSLFDTDHVHPSDLGHDAIASMLFSMLTGIDIPTPIWERVYLGFGSTWKTLRASIVWTEVSGDVLDRNQPITTSRGGTDASPEADGGQIACTLRNHTRDYDPRHIDGPYYGLLKAGTPVKVTSTPAGGVETTVAFGFTGDFKQRYARGNRYAYVPIEAHDLDRLSAATIPRTPIAATVLPLDPVGYWPLTDPAGPSVSDSTGRLFGTIVDEPDLAAGELLPGLGPSMGFDGINDRIDISSGPIITDEYVWCFVAVMRTAIPAEFASSHPLFFQLDGNNAAYSVQVYVHTDGKLALVGAKNGLRIAVTSTVAVDDDYPHIVFVQVGYLTGEDQGLGIDTPDLTWLPFTPATQGGSGTAIAGTSQAARGYDDNYFPGRLSHVMIFDRVLVDAERAAVFESFSCLDGQSTDERIAWFLDELGWPADARDLSTGVTILGPATFNAGDKALDMLQKLARSEAGRLFMDAQGRLTFHDRFRPWTDPRATIPQVTFTDVAGDPGVSGFELDPESDEQIINVARYSRRGGTEQVFRDDDSIDQYGESEDSQDDLLLATDGEAYQRARFAVTTQAEPQPKIPTLTVNLHTLTPEQQAQILALEIGDRIRNVRTPQGVGDPMTIDCVIDGVDHEITKVTHVVEFHVSPAPDISVDLFLLGISELGGADVLAF